MISQHWFRQWLGAVRQQAITWANVDPDLCRHMMSLGHNELRQKQCTTPGTWFNIKTVFSGIEVSIIKMRWSPYPSNLYEGNPYTGNLGNKFQRNSNWDWNIFIKQNAFANVFVKWVSLCLGPNVLISPTSCLQCSVHDEVHMFTILDLMLCGWLLRKSR